MKRLLIVLICLIVISASALFVGCGNNPAPNTPPNIDLENNQNGTEPEDSIEPENPTIPENPQPSPEEPSTPPTSEIPPEEDLENNGGDLTPENPSNPNPPTDEEDGSENNPTTPPNNDNDETDNNEPTIPEDPEPTPEPEPNPEPEPEPIITFDFTIYNSKENVIYNLENNKILVTLSENESDNIVHFKCLIYVDDALSTDQNIKYTLTNADKLANSNPQNLSNFYFKFNQSGTYVLTLSDSTNTNFRIIDIIVE